MNGRARIELTIGTLLAEIRDDRLYRHRYPTFEAYCTERWGIDPAEAERLIAEAEADQRRRQIGVLA